MHLREAAYELGCILPEPFLQVAFLALPVIPHLKMTDRGLFDVDKFDFVDMSLRAGSSPISTSCPSANAASSAHRNIRAADVRRRRR